MDEKNKAIVFSSYAKILSKVYAVWDTLLVTYCITSLNANDAKEVS